MNETPTNEALAAQAKAGDREALAALWEQNRGLLALLFRKLEAYRENILSGSSYHGTGFSAWKERGSVEERLAERIEAYAERGTTNAFISDVMRIRGCSREEVLQRYPELSS